MNDKKSLTLEAGKYYQTRDGRKVYIVGQNPFDKDDDDIGFPFGGFVQRHKGDCLEWWRADGVFGVRQDALDLVSEWIEPKRIKGWIAVFGRDEGASSLAAVSDVFATREQVLAAIHRPATAIINIDVLEGAGLEGEVA
ncbi:hypothetical protein [Rhizobium leguminosarum]|uniref:hypothetical protein n=1 Tax=Rhizobium leguminosarum TaxID=384 RepID=UPI0035110742